MKVNVFTRIHIGHADFLDSWIKSIKDNSNQIDTVIIWLSDRDTSAWYLREYHRFSEINLPICSITNYGSDAISCLSLINDYEYRIGAVLDFDDIWLPNHLSLALSETKNFEFKTFYAGRSNFVDITAKLILGTHMLPAQRSDVLIHTPIAFSAMVWKPGTIEVDLRYNRMIDQSIVYQAFSQNQVAVGETISVKIRKHGNSMSGKLLYQFFDRFRFLFISRNPLILLNLIFGVIKKYKLRINSGHQ